MVIMMKMMAAQVTLERSQEVSHLILPFRATMKAAAVVGVAAAATAVAVERVTTAVRSHAITDFDAK